MTQTNLCSVCRSINIETVTRPNGLLLHGSLKELSVCAETCILCQRAMDNILGQPSKNFTSERPWLDCTTHDQYLARVVRATFFGDESLAIIVKHRADRSICGLCRDPEHEHAWLMLYTLEHDPAVSYGLPWVRLLPESTSSPASINVARAWIERCIAGLCDGKGKARRNELVECEQRPDSGD